MYWKFYHYEMFSFISSNISYLKVYFKVALNKPKKKKTPKKMPLQFFNGHYLLFHSSLLLWNYLCFLLQSMSCIDSILLDLALFLCSWVIYILKFVYLIVHLRTTICVFNLLHSASGSSSSSSYHGSRCGSLHVYSIGGLELLGL